jgi:hypothetical protein
MVRAPATTSIERDNAVSLLRELTTACALAATVLLGLFSVIAAATIPGGQANPASAGTGTPASDTQQTSSDDNGQLQPPSAGQVSAGGGLPVAVTGGSGH